MSDETGALTFEALYEAYAERVVNLAYRLTANEETAHDLTQEIFVKVYQNLATFEHKSHVYTWIYRIAFNHIMNHLKRERRYRWANLMDKKVSDVVREEDVEPTFWARPTVPSSERKLEKTERAKVVWSTIQTLPDKYRVPLVLHHYEEMSYKEIAETMGLSMSAVEARIHRAKKQLIKKLEPWLDHI